MPLPKQRELEIPLLKALEELQGAAAPQDIYPKVAEYFPELSEEDQVAPMAKQPSIRKWWNRIQWVRQKLVARGELDGSERGIWKITDKGRDRLRNSDINESNSQTPPLELKSLFTEILERYPIEFAKDSKTSNPYFKELKKRLRDALSPATSQYGLEISAIGGQGRTRTNPYITFTPKGHRTNKGFYPALFFDIAEQKVILILGFSTENSPPPELAASFSALAVDYLPAFPLTTEQGCPSKEYRKDEISNTILTNELLDCFEAFNECMQELENEIKVFITSNTRQTSGTSASIPRDQMQVLIDSFLVWFNESAHAKREHHKEYEKFSRDYFANLSDIELVEEFFQFARNGGFIQSGGARTAGRLKTAIQQNIEDFRRFILEVFEPNFEIEKWWKGLSAFNGFGKGIGSIFLHRVFPLRFAVFNKTSLDGYRLLGILPSGRLRGNKYILTNEAAQKLVDLRPDELSLFRADAMTHFIIATDEGKQALQSALGSDEEEIEDRLHRANYWLLSAGIEGKKSDEFLNKNIIGLGWDKLGDLNNFESENAIFEQLQRIYPSKKSPVNNAKACWSFANDIQDGDYVFLKVGYKGILGLGQVSSNYIFDQTRDSFKHVRRLKWLKTGNWQLDEVEQNLTVKTLSHLVDRSPLLKTLLELLDIDEATFLSPDDLKDYESFSVEEAVAPLFIERDAFEGMLSTLRYKKNIILQGPPGVGKTFIARRLAFALLEEKAEDRVSIIQFHQSYSYEDFIQGYRPEKNTFKRKDGIFFEFCKKAQRDPENDYVFIIDEINRGNLSKIFGELMLLIEADKRGAEYGVQLTYSDEFDQPFHIPKNLYMIGTMNTADRSLAIVDYALRRRFRFIELSPQFESARFGEFLDNAGVSSSLVDKIVSRVTTLNRKISEDKKDLGKGYCVGHSFFVPNGTEQPLDDTWYNETVRLEIAPLLREYWFDNEDLAEKEIISLLD